MSRIKIEDAARRLGISRSKVYEHITAGKLSRVKDGARAFVTEGSLLALEAADNPAPAQAEAESGPISAADAAQASDTWAAAVRNVQEQERRQRAADIDALAEAVAKRIKVTKADK